MALRLVLLILCTAAVGLFIFGIGCALWFGVEPAVGPLLVYALAFITIILVAISSASGILRRRRMLLILGNLEKASQLNLPLSRMILAAAQGEKGVLRLRLMALHDRLDAGEPLDQALIHFIPEISLHAVRAIGAGQRMGCLSHVLSGLTRRRSGQDLSLARNLGIYRVYPIVFLAVLWLFLIVVLPKFQGMFHDFKTVLPQPTRFLMDLSHQPSFWWVLLTLAALAPLGRTFQNTFPSFRKISPFGGSVGDRFIWWMPVAGGYVRDRGMADLCDLAAVGVEMGHPLDQTLRDAADAQPSAVMRHRTAAWADAIARGQPIHEAARFAGFPDLFVSMLATVRDSDGLLQVLEFLWRHYEYRFVRTRTVIQAAYVPIVVFLMGAMVALLGVSLLKPMAMMNQHIAGSISGGF
ncbi:MAG: type II secretion system F family protein [Tepidisphaeraceae bacterium]